jgi:AcrR family transcriptional regulator
MSAGGLRERKKQRTREAIAQAGLALFASRGYAATTVTDIAEAAEVSRATLFAYFPSKEDILFADHALTRSEIEHVLASRPPDVAALDALWEYVLANLQPIEDRARLRRSLVRDDPQLMSSYGARMAAIGDVIAAAVALDLGDPADGLRPRLVAAAFTAAFGVTEEYRLSRGEASPSRDEVVGLLSTTITFLRSGLKAIQ